MHSPPQRVLIFGAGGAIGSALVEAYAKHENTHVYAVSRNPKPSSHHHPNIENIQVTFDGLSGQGLEAALTHCCEQLKAVGELHRVIIASGFLHGSGISPEKSLKQLSFAQMASVFNINTLLPALCAQAFLPLLGKKQTTVFAALSARVGSISDNRLGGWYSYRASKAALNMLLKTASIEVQRSKPNAVVVGLHPGTVDSALSAPFSSRVADDKLFQPAYAAQKLMAVIENLQPEDSGKVFAWDGKTIPA